LSTSSGRSSFISDFDTDSAAVDELLRERTTLPESSGERNAIRDRLRTLREKTLGGFNARV